MMEPYDLHGSLGYQITLLARISERRFERALTPLGLSRVTWCVLLALEQQGLHSPSEIASYIGIDRTATSRALRRLEHSALVKRQGGQRDRRTTRVTITGKGRSTLARATDAARENAAHFNEKLSRPEREALGATIARLMTGETQSVPGL